MLEVLKCSIGSFNFTDDTLLIPTITVLVVNVIKIAVPIMLIIFGMLDLAKAVVSNDEKEMKGAQTKLMKRAIYAVLVFLVISIVQLLFGALATTGGTDKATISGCITCFTSDVDACTK